MGVPVSMPPADPPRPAREATLAVAFTRQGRGLHTGRRASVTVLPAPAGHGHVFRRLGPRGTSEVLARTSAVTPAILCTALLYPDGRVLRTVEHLLAALNAYAIDNTLIEIMGEELPIFDGSAVPWCDAIASVGRVELDAPRHYVRVIEPVDVGDAENHLRIEPSEDFSIEIEVPLAHFGNLTWAGRIDRDTFRREIAPARSFGRLKWALPMKLYNLVSMQPVLRGANLSTTAAIVGGRIIGGMRVPAEPACHRALDVVGDFALIGRPVLGHIKAYRTGHVLNHRLTGALMARREAWEIVDGEGRVVPDAPMP